MAQRQASVPEAVLRENCIDHESASHSRAKDGLVRPVPVHFQLALGQGRQLQDRQVPNVFEIYDQPVPQIPQREFLQQCLYKMVSEQPIPHVCSTDQGPVRSWCLSLDL
jgi:hypothetical protein